VAKPTRRQQRLARIPKLIKFLGMHAIFGAILGVAVAVGLLWLDVAGIGTLFLGERAPIIAGLLYFGSFAFTFASFAMGTAVMLLPKDEDDFRDS